MIRSAILSLALFLPFSALAQITVSVNPQKVSIGQPVTVTWVDNCASDCLRADFFSTTVDRGKIVHRYRTVTIAEVCARVCRDRGYQISVTINEPGRYEGEIRLNGRLLGSYVVDVLHPDRGRRN
jgi:hypothetical protein